MKILIASSIALSLALASAASAETLSEKTGVNSALGVAPDTADFVSEATIGGMFEIQSSKLAEQSNVGYQTKLFASKMITDHGKISDELAPLAKSANIAVPTALDSAHQKMLDQLTAAKGDDFAKLYHDDQVTAHKEAESLFERYSKGGQNPQLKSLAAKALPIIQDHLKMAQDLDKKSS
jgi:putative membrane protein